MKPITLPAKMSRDSPLVCVSKSPAELGFALYWEFCNTTGAWDTGLCPKIESNCSKYLLVWRFRPNLLLCAFIFLYLPFSFFIFSLHCTAVLPSKPRSFRFGAMASNTLMFHVAPSSLAWASSSPHRAINALTLLSFHIVPLLFEVHLASLLTDVMLID